MNFNSLITGPPIKYDNNATAGWYVDGVKVYDMPGGFTDRPTKTTEYTLRFTTDGTLYEYSNTVTVYEPPILEIITPNNETICSGESISLNATVTNATSLTKILWTYDGGTFTNGYSFNPRSTGTHTITATANNSPPTNPGLCPQKSETLHFTVNFNPTLANGEISTDLHCPQETINLNDCIDFFVYDTHANYEKRPASHTTRTIRWRNAANTPVSDPEHVLLTSLNDTTFYADLSDITVYYSTSPSTCNPSFQEKVESPTLPLRVPITITSNHFDLDYGYDNMCRGDSVYAKFQLLDGYSQLLDGYSQPSTCDTIKELTILGGHTPERNIRESPTEKILVFAPFTGLDDTIRVNAKGSLAGVDTVFKLFLRNTSPPVINSDAVCINTDADFRVIADHCDTIRDVKCTFPNENMTASTVSKTDNLWILRVPDLPGTTTFQCAVTYFSKLDDKVIEDYSLTHTLRIWEDPPVLSVSLMYNDALIPFDNTTQNLCLGDSLLFVFSAPHDCDTIKNIEWLQNSGTFTRRDSHTWEAIVKPAQEGDHAYDTRVSYRRPKETADSTAAIPYTVTVKLRPRLFVNPPDTLKYCYSRDAPLNLNPPNPSADIINHHFLNPDYGVIFETNGKADFQPNTTGNYGVGAYYTHLCSEMYTLHAWGEVRIVVNSEDEDGASFIMLPNKGFCASEGITITSYDREGSSLAWEHNGTPVTLPYRPAPGAYALTTLIYNACFPQNSPKTYSVNVQVVANPKIQVMPDITVCHDDIVELKALEFVGDELIWTYTSGEITSSTVTIENTTTFRGIAHNANDICDDTYDEVTIFRMSDAFVQLMPDTSACLYDEIRLRVVQKEGDEIRWSDSHFFLIGTGESITVTVGRNETYTATISNQCNSYSADLKVTSLYLPEIELKIDTSICYGESLNLNSRISDSQGILHWMPDESTAGAITESTMYIATVSTEKCGSASDSMYVNVYQQLLLLPDNLPHYNTRDFYDVHFQTLHAVPDLAYHISGTLPPGLMPANGRLYGQPVLGPADYNTHQVQVSIIDGHHCKASKEYILAPEWKAANVLLPMGDAGNAIFLPGYDLEVYNRNGLLIHKGMGWNGSWNNTFVPAGTYFYNVKILIDRMPEKRMGYVVVMYY